MNPRLRHLGAELSQPRVLARLTKIAVVLALEVSVAPLALAATLLTKDERRAERLLLLQNRFRRLSLHWIFPEFRKRSNESG